MILMYALLHPMEIFLLFRYLGRVYFKPFLLCSSKMFFHWLIQSLSLGKCLSCAIIAKVGCTPKLIYFMAYIIGLEVSRYLMSALILLLLYDFGSFFLFALSYQIIVFLVVLLRFFHQNFLLRLLLESVPNAEHFRSCIKCIIISIIAQYTQSSMSNQSERSTPPFCTPPKISRSPVAPTQNERQIQILQQNKQLRKKLRLLSSRLDQELEKAAKDKLKVQHNLNTASQQSMTKQLQNAYKVIERLQKSVKDIQNKEQYQLNYKRISEMENLLRKRQNENEQLKQQVKDARKMIRDKERYIDELLQKVGGKVDLNEQKDTIQRLKMRMKNVLAENEQLKIKELEKHKKLVSAQRKLVQMEQNDPPIGMQEELVEELELYKTKHTQAMARIQKQNAYITKLNAKISKLEESAGLKKSRSYHTSQQPKKISRSMDELPDLDNSKVKPSIFDHIPSPNLPTKLLRRY